MKQQNRSAIVISALLTTLIMTLIGGGLLVYSGVVPLDRVLAQGQQAQPTQDDAPIVVTVQPALEMQQAAPVIPAEANTLGAEPVVTQAAEAVSAPQITDPEILIAYQTQLEEAYKALEEAYAQIETLQAAQSQPPSRPHYEEENEEREQDEGGSIVHFRGDDNERNEHEGREWDND